MIAVTSICVLYLFQHSWSGASTFPRVAAVCPIGAYYPEFWDSFTLFQINENDNDKRVPA